MTEISLNVTLNNQIHHISQMLSKHDGIIYKHRQIHSQGSSHFLLRVKSGFFEDCYYIQCLVVQGVLKNITPEPPVKFKPNI